MAVTVTNNATTIWDCESTTGAVGNKPALEAEILKENANSVDFTSTQTTTKAAYDGSGIPSTLTTASHLRAWYTSITFPNMAVKTEGGVCFYISDGSNTAYWFVAGKDTYTGGWLNIVINLGVTPDYGTLPVLANVDEVGIAHGKDGSSTLNLSYATRPKNQINVWVDYFRYGDGLLAYGTPLFGIDTLALADQASGAGYGVIETVNETHFIYGSLEYGRTSEQTIYEEINELIVFANAQVSSTLYGIKFTGNTSVTSTFKMSGCVISSAGERFYLDFDDTNIADLEFTGNTVAHANNINFLSSTSLTNISGNSFSDCLAIYPKQSTFESNSVTASGVITIVSGGSFTKNTISNTTSASSVNCSDLSYVEGNTFVSSGSSHAIELTSVGSGTMTFDNSTTGFDAGSTGSPVTPTNTGNEDIYVSASSGTLTINVSATATTPSIRSAGAIVNVVAGQKNFKFTLDPSLTAYEWRIYSVDAVGSMDGATELDGQEDATADNQTYSYSYTSDTPIAVQIINQPDNDYEESVTYYTLGNADQDISIILKKDNNN